MMESLGLNKDQLQQLLAMNPGKLRRALREQLEKEPELEPQPPVELVQAQLQADAQHANPTE